MTTEDIRKRVEENAEGDVLFGRDEVAELLADRDRLRAMLDNLHADYQARLARCARMLEKRSEERDQLARKVKAARALADNPHFLFSTRELHAALDSTDR